jgi:enoyl-[acyl-carrier protein] reductase II
VISVPVDPDLPVIPVRALANRGTQQFAATQRQVAARFRGGEISQDEAQLQIELFWAGALKRAVVEGDVDRGSLMAGQSVGMVTCEQPTDKIISDLVGQAIAALADQQFREAL